MRNEVTGAVARIERWGEMLLGFVCSAGFLLVIVMDTPGVSISRGLFLVSWAVGLLCLYQLPPDKAEFRFGYLAGLAVAVVAWVPPALGWLGGVTGDVW